VINGTLGPLGMIIDPSTGAITGTAIEGTANDYAVKGTNASGSDTTNIDSIVVSAVGGSVFNGVWVDGNIWDDTDTWVDAI